MGDGNDTVAGGNGASWTDTINLHDGASALGTYGVDWTLSITSGSIISTDTAHHTITLSQDTAGHIDLSNGATINFTSSNDSPGRPSNSIGHAAPHYP